MDQELIVRRRRIGEGDLVLIRGLINQEGHRGRTHLSRRLCEIWDWRQSNGRFRQIACRDLLRQLHAKGLVKLPPMLKGARRVGYRNAVGPPELLDRVFIEGPLATIGKEIQPINRTWSWRKPLSKGIASGANVTRLPTGFVSEKAVVGVATIVSIKSLSRSRPSGCTPCGQSFAKFSVARPEP